MCNGPAEFTVVFHNGVDSAEPFEYFCKGCKQLRLSFRLLDICGNCGSPDIIKGKVGTLDKEKLVKE